MDKQKIEKRLSEILPAESCGCEVTACSRDQELSLNADKIKRSVEKDLLAKKRYAEEAKKKRAEKRLSEVSDFINSGASAPVRVGQALSDAKKIEETTKKIEAIERLMDGNQGANDIIDLTDAANSAVSSSQPVSPQVSQALVRRAVSDAQALRGTTRPEMAKLLSALNINIDLQLTKNDTANLLACLLTCNSTQLNALYSNAKVPIVIKTIIKRLLDESKNGSTDMIEKIWKRVFGDAPLQASMPEQSSVKQDGILPNQPISREAYIVIRDTLIQ